MTEEKVPLFDPSQKDDVEARKEDIINILNMEVGSSNFSLFFTKDIKAWKAYYYHMKNSHEEGIHANKKHTFKLVQKKKEEVNKNFGKMYQVIRLK